MDNIVVTGSREYNDWKLVFDILGEYSLFHLKVGDCPTGADLFASQWWYANFGEFPEIFRAEWDKYRKAAGPIRNHRMIDSGVDIVLAFPVSNSKGTLDCATYAFSKGIPVRFPQMERDKGRYHSFTEPEWYQWAEKLSVEQK